jgi:uncharacterized repeat protein (TIGR03803 family)
VTAPSYALQAGPSRPLSLRNAGVPSQTQETALYSFASGSGGSYPDPVGKLTDVNGVLYGTTRFGGTNDDGTIFKITTAGTLSVLYSFAGGSDGAGPEAGLTDVNGVLYGTTEGGGGANNDGTVFKITTSGAESVLHRFGGSDGANPQAKLTNVNGVLFGTTLNGGTYRFGGTVFKITTSGTLTVLHKFGGGSDGEGPNADLTDVDGVLYGTTTSNGDSPYYGTVYQITTSGAESVLHRFQDSDGATPDAGLTYVNGALYGTTYDGGAKGDGTVFKITTSGTETVLHSFLGGSDGRGPFADLTNVNGVLYGTTQDGGVDFNTGTVFKVTTAGAKSTVYSFVRGSDGSEPLASLTNVNGVLYGTTYYGGASNKGTIFSLSL